MNSDVDEVKKRFDGQHSRGMITFLATGISRPHKLMSLFLEAESASQRGAREIRVEYQLTVEQTKFLIQELLLAVDELSKSLN